MTGENFKISKMDPAIASLKEEKKIEDIVNKFLGDRQSSNEIASPGLTDKHSVVRF